MSSTPSAPACAATHAGPRWFILPCIVLAQLAGTSLWFGTNATMPQLQRELLLSASQVATLLSAVNMGFILGTLCYALLMIADRFSPRWVFLVSALLAATVNIAPVLAPAYPSLLLSRLAVGFLLAGIYPVGMKIAASWYRGGLGAALGFLVGALVVGTALPHALVGLGARLPWQSTMLALSALAMGGGILLATFVADGPWLGRSGPIRFGALAVVWRDDKVRASAFGYFGHMFELYAVLAAVPMIIASYLHSSVTPAVSLASAVVIGAGGLGCAGGGLLVRRLGSARVASLQLAISGLCCLLTPIMMLAPWWLFAPWLVIWGLTVSGDSPQFSTLTALNSPPDVVGSVLTLVNSIGFLISVVTILATAWAMARYGIGPVLPWLALGPLFGLWAMRNLIRPPALPPP